MTWYRRLATRCEKREIKDRSIEHPYITRYTVFKSWLFKVYLHQIHRSDSSQDYHDHPWPFFHYILEGGYWEESLGKPKKLRLRGHWAFRRAGYNHRLDLIGERSQDVSKLPLETWTFVVVGPRMRDWGFLGRITGCWVKWDKYVFDGERCE